MNNKRNMVDIVGSALILLSLFLSFFKIGNLSLLDLLKGMFKASPPFSETWYFYCLVLGMIGALLLLLSSLFAKSGFNASGIGYFLAVSGTAVFIIKMLVETKGDMFKAAGAGFYCLLIGTVVLLIRPAIKNV